MEDSQLLSLCWTKISLQVFPFQFQLQWLLSSSFPPSLNISLQPPSFPGPTLAVVPEHGLGCLPGPRPGAGGTDGLRAVPKAVILQVALAQRAIRKLLPSLMEFCEVTIMPVPVF